MNDILNKKYGYGDKKKKDQKKITQGGKKGEDGRMVDMEANALEEQ